MIRRFLKGGLKKLGGDVGIGGDEREHRRHVGRDHSRALCHAADDHLDSIEIDSHSQFLRKLVRRHDGLSRRRVTVNI